MAAYSKNQIRLFASAVMSMAMLGCTSGFQAAQSVKISQLASQSLMSAGQTVSATCITPTGIESPDACTTPTPTPNPSATPNPTPNPTATPPPITPPSAPIVPVCSITMVANENGSVKASSHLSIQLVDAAGNVACQYVDDSLKTTIQNERKIQFPADLSANCPSLPAGTYGVRLRGDASKNLLTTGMVTPATQDTGDEIAVGGRTDLLVPFYNLFYGSPADSYWSVTVDAFNRRLMSRADTPITTLAVAWDTNNVNYWGEYKTAECDVASSPLIVQLIPGTEAVQPINLSAPLSGIKFDIFGTQSLPTAHLKQQISWLTPVSAQHNYFLVLPAADGSVTGIDQLFGNNTMGPDGKTAANGYEALRKFDGRRANGSLNLRARDGVIDAKDAVFSQLRLWADTNIDGIADASELHSLDELGVTSINLNYDSNYSETDKYGNEIKMKSMVETRDGLSHVMYDLWFRVVSPL